MKIFRTIALIVLAAISAMVFLKHCDGCEFIAEKESGKVLSVYENDHDWGSGEENSLILSIVKCKTMSTEEGRQYVGDYYFDKGYMSEINLDAFNSGMVGLSYEGVFQCLFKIEE